MPQTDNGSGAPCEPELAPSKGGGSRVNGGSLPIEANIVPHNALSAQVDGARKLPSSVVFKGISGDPVPPLTHELYVSAGSGARRIFGRYERDHFTVDALAEHL